MGKKQRENLYSVKSDWRHRTKVEKLGSLRVETIEKWKLKMKQPKTNWHDTSKWMVGARFFVLMLGNTEIKQLVNSFTNAGTSGWSALISWRHHRELRWTQLYGLPVSPCEKMLKHLGTKGYISLKQSLTHTHTQNQYIMILYMIQVWQAPPPPPRNVMYPYWPPSPSPPVDVDCGFSWVGNVALVLELPHNDRCGVIRGSQRRGTWMGQTKWSA